MWGKCLGRAFAWNAKGGSSSQHVGQKYIKLPWAISDPNKHVTFSDACPVPSSWSDCLACRECKRALVLYFGEYTSNRLQWVHVGFENIKVILAGCFSGVEEDQALEVTTRGAQPVLALSCEAEEADTSVATCAEKFWNMQTSVLSGH